MIWKIILAFAGGLLAGAVAGFVTGVRLTARNFAEIMAEALTKGRYEANDRVFKIEEVTDA